jgi:hypothetical protein
MKVKITDLTKFKTTLMAAAKMADDLSKHTAEQCVQLYTQGSTLIAKAVRNDRYVACLAVPVEVIKEGSVFIHAKELEALLKPLDTKAGSLDLYEGKGTLVLNLYSLGKRSKTTYPDITEFPSTGLAQPFTWERILTSIHLGNTLKDSVSYVGSTGTLWLQGFIEEDKGYVRVACKGTNSGYLKKEIEDEDLQREFNFHIKPNIANLIHSIEGPGGISLYASPTSNTFKVESGDNSIIFATTAVNNSELSSMVNVMSGGQMEPHSILTCNYMEFLSAINWQGADDEGGDLTISSEEGYLTISNKLTEESAKLQMLSTGGEEWEPIQFKTETLKRIVAAVEAPNSSIELSTKVKAMPTGDGNVINYTWLVLTPVTKYGGGFPTGLISMARSV